MKHGTNLDIDAALMPLQTPKSRVRPAAARSVDTGVGLVSVTGVPTVGQTIVATSATTATWQTPATGADEVFNAEDDGFDATSLNAKWTQSFTGTLPTIAFNSQEARSRMLFKFAGAAVGAVTLKQAYSPAGDFSLTAKFQCQWLNSSSILYLYVLNTAETDGVFFEVTGLGANQATANLRHLPTFGIQSSISGFVTRSDGVYAHLQRVGTTWTAALSFDGVAWQPFPSTLTKTVTINKILLQFAQGIATKERMGIDWVRRDWFFW